MIILDNTRGAWWLAKLKNPKPGFRSEGYIPSNYVAVLNSNESFDWFVGQANSSESYSQNHTVRNVICLKTSHFRTSHFWTIQGVTVKWLKMTVQEIFHWTFLKYPRQLAERDLNQNPIGTFLIRNGNLFWKTFSRWAC